MAPPPLGPGRQFATKKPPDWRPPVPRSRLLLPPEASAVYTLYIGVQHHARGTDNSWATTHLEESIESWLSSIQDERVTAPRSTPETFRVTEGFDLNNTRVWVAYCTSEAVFQERLGTLDINERWLALPDDERSHVGIWHERFFTPLKRLETNYSRVVHRPGLANLQGSSYEPHDLSGYWGAARDRLPASAFDLFNASESQACLVPQPRPKGIGERLSGTNYDDMCHIRSGQWWALCTDEERRAYEENLEPDLMKGMSYLCTHAEETGTLAFRFLVSLDESGNPARETCGAGFFRNWTDLERWSSRHPSHLAIFNGSIKHAKDSASIVS